MRCSSGTWMIARFESAVLCNSCIYILKANTLADNFIELWCSSLQRGVLRPCNRSLHKGSRMKQLAFFVCEVTLSCLDRLFHLVAHSSEFENIVGKRRGATRTCDSNASIMSIGGSRRTRWQIWKDQHTHSGSSPDSRAAFWLSRASRCKSREELQDLLTGCGFLTCKCLCLPWVSFKISYLIGMFLLARCTYPVAIWRPFLLIADSAYINASLGRIMRALFEICIRRGWCSMAALLLEYCKAVDHRVWPHQHPLRQFDAILSQEVRNCSGCLWFSFDM